MEVEEGFVYIKKEGEDKDMIKKEEGGEMDVDIVHPLRRTPTTKAGIDVAAGMSRINGGMASLVTQYNQTTRFNETNMTNTQEIDRTIQEMENYVYRMHKEGEVTLSLFAYCNKVIEATRRWNSVITEQQTHMKDYVLNSIVYNKELHALYTEMTRRQPGSGPGHRRDPSSPFNTIKTDVEYMTLNNDNDAFSSIF